MSRFTDFFSNLGHGLSSGISAIGKPLLGAFSSLAPMAGTAIGGMFGGPGGAMIGNSLGGMAGNIFGNLSGGGGGGSAPQQPQQPMDAAGGMGGMIGNQVNQMLPEQYQNMALGPMATAARAGMGNQFEQMLPPAMQGFGLGQKGGDFLNGRLSGPFSRMPGQGQNLGQAASGMGSYLGNGMQNMRSRFGAGLQNMRSRIGFADGGHIPIAFHNLRDMGDMMGHHFDDGGPVY